jgi:hypothetical protein
LPIDHRQPDHRLDYTFFMAAADHALPIKNEIPMELPTFPPNQALEAFKDVVFGSV